MSYQFFAILLVLVSACNGQRPWERSVVQPPCQGDLPLSKLMLNQSDYVQYVHYFTPIPDIKSFTMQYWFNLIDTERTSTMFDYTMTGETNSTIFVQLQRGSPQKWNLIINDILVSSVASPLVKAGDWHYMVHSWNSNTGLWSIFMDGTILGTGYSRQGLRQVVRGGGEATSGQRQSTHVDGMDRREGLEGWFTLFQMTSQSLLYPQSPQTSALVSNLAARCDSKQYGDIISWTRTPRKVYGGLMEAPAKPVCGHF